MPAYTVQHTPIIHGPKDATGPESARRYEVGEEIELSAVEAERLGDNLAAAPAREGKKGK